MNFYYLQLYVSGDKLKCNPSIQYDKGEQRPQDIPRVLIIKFHQSMDFLSDYDQRSTYLPTALSLLLSFDKSTDDSPLVPSMISDAILITPSRAPSNHITDIVTTPHNHSIIPQDLSNPQDKLAMSRLLSGIVSMHKQHNIPIEYESWNDTNMLLVHILSVTAGEYKGFYKSMRTYE